MERKDDYTHGALAGKEVAGDYSIPSMSSSSSSHGSLPVQSEDEKEKDRRGTERFLEYQRKKAAEQQIRMHEIKSRDKEAQNSEDEKLTGDQLRTMIRHKLKELDDLEESMIETEDGELLPTSHHILFKLSDYVSLPRNMNSSTIFNQVFGRRMMDKEGFYLKGDDGRFLFIFHDLYSFILVSMAFLILMAQYELLFNLYNRSDSSICDETLYYNTSHPSWEVIFLCVVYAAGQATEDFFVIMPFEIMGINLESYCLHVHRRVQQGYKVKTSFWWRAVKHFFRQKEEEYPEDNANAPDEEDVHIASRFRVLTDLIVAIAVSYTNSSMVFFTVVVMGFQIAYSSGTVDMIQNFIAVEIILHVNEVLPRMFWIKDLSPYRFRKSLYETLHELEQIKAIPTYYRDKDGADTHRIRWSYSQIRTIVFSLYIFVMSLSIAFVSISYRSRCGNTDPSENDGDDGAV